MPVAEKMQSEVLSLPMYPELTREQMDAVIAALEEAI
jgi:dTDP-4-amino-4,6-dideoxygalactose transaminase